MRKEGLRKAVIAAAIVCVPALLFASTPPNPVDKTQVMNKAYRMQIPFIENRGQVGSDENSLILTFKYDILSINNNQLAFNFLSNYVGVPFLIM